MSVPVLPEVCPYPFSFQSYRGSCLGLWSEIDWVVTLSKLHWVSGLRYLEFLFGYHGTTERTHAVRTATSLRLKTWKDKKQSHRTQKGLLSVNPFSAGSDT